MSKSAKRKCWIGHFVKDGLLSAGERSEISHNMVHGKRFRTAIRQIDDYRTGLHPSNWIAGGHSLWSFYNEMKKGDLVILVGANSRRELVVEVADESIEWKSKRESATFDDCQHQRNAQMRNDLNADTLWSEAGSSTAQGYSVHWALSKCAR